MVLVIEFSIGVSNALLSFLYRYAGVVNTLNSLYYSGDLPFYNTVLSIIDFRVLSIYYIERRSS